MKNFILAALCFEFFFSLSAFADTKPFVDGEVLVKYRHAISAGAISHSLDQLNGIKLQTALVNSDLVRVQLLANQKVEDALFQLRSDPAVEYAQPNYIYHATSHVPNDPYFSQQWALNNVGQAVPSPSPSTGPNDPDTVHNPGIAGNDMGLESAWDYVTNCSSVVVAVVDTGIDYSHEDLAANMWDGSSLGLPHHGKNFQGTMANDPMDDNGHGTHVAGTIGAVGNNGLGGTGICWNASLMAVKVLDSTGTGSTINIADGITWAAQNGARVINLSLGSTADDTTMDAAIVTAQNSGALVVAAAGNNSGNNDVAPFYPCNTKPGNLICVGAVDQDFQLASFSNYGTTVDVAAPGVNIVSTWPYAITRMKDDFTSWQPNPAPQPSGYWGVSPTTRFGVTAGEPLLSNPPNWDLSTAIYANNENEDYYRQYNLTPPSGVWDVLKAQFYEGYTIETGDAVSTYIKSTGGDPVVGGTAVANYSGSSGGAALPQSFNLLSYGGGSCATSTCSIGFNFLSDATAQSFGTYIIRFEIQAGNYSTSSYNVDEGTSMAAPHVAGLAALLMSYNPSYTYADVISVLKNTGTAESSLATTIGSGKVVNAMSALQYIATPQGVTATKQ